MSSENLICFAISGFENEQFVFECYNDYCSIFKLKIYTVFSVLLSVFKKSGLIFSILIQPARKQSEKKIKEKDQFLGPEKRWGITTCLDF
jgi:hypothetical protein